MAAGAVSSVPVSQHDVRWKWLLLGLCALVFLVAVASAMSVFGFFSRPWFGWWDMYGTQERPYTFVITSTPAGGAAARAEFELATQSTFASKVSTHESTFTVSR
jgi:hypothetical protein